MAARIRQGAAAALSVIVAAVVIGLMMTMGDTVPLWYQVGFLVFGPLVSLAGGALSRRQERRSR